MKRAEAKVAVRLGLLVVLGAQATACFGEKSSESPRPVPATGTTPEAARTGAVERIERLDASPLPPDAAVPTVELTPAMLSLFQPLPDEMASPTNPLTEDKIALGRMLYFDKRLSKNQDVSCNSCHGLATFGVDNKPTSPGHKGQLGGRNSPTVYNAAGHFVQFWDGRSPDVEDQAKGPILNPVEMAMPSAEAVVALLKSIPGYVEAFGKAFPGEADPVTFDNYAKAVGAFERRLVTPAPWDRFLKGEATALTDQQKAGFKAFYDAGCITCHTGAYVGAAMYQKAGLAKPWPDIKDNGRFDVTKNEADRHFFKVPSLRNIAKTGPYFHDGGVADLTEAVKRMADLQLAKPVSDVEATAIVAWLDSLTGDVPAAYITEPTLPPSSDKTPKPDPN